MLDAEASRMDMTTATIGAIVLIGAALRMQRIAPARPRYDRRA